jgi:hypothetical protein
MTILGENLAAGPIRERPRYLTSGRVGRRYEKTVRTIDRWLDAGILPQPDLVIRGRRYWAAETLEKFHAEQRDLARGRHRTVEPTA